MGVPDRLARLDVDTCLVGTWAHGARRDRLLPGRWLWTVVEPAPRDSSHEEGRTAVRAEAPFGLEAESGFP